MPAPRAEAARHPLDVLGAALLAAATAGFILICVWGGRRYPWGAPEVLALAGLTGALVLALVLRERRAADPIVPFELLRTGTMAIACSVLFLTTAALFAVNVFVPLYLQTTTGATPTEAGLLLVPMMLGITVSTNLAGRGIARTGRYKRYPVAGAAMMTLALIELAAVAGSPSRLTIGIGLAIFGLGFGMVGQVLIVAVQNAVDRGRLGVAMAATSFSRGLGGAVGAALLGAVFASRVAGSTAPAAARGDLIDGVQSVFIAAAPLVALALAAVLLLQEPPLRGREPTTSPPPPKGPTWQTATDATTATGGRATAASAPETAIARPSRPSSANSI
jgi:predicted MFS family arabinose efflux permease